ncbi:hypothetical protein [Laribacter hongkongensis]|nr:hypothetical protein [Laribacter hongkongensis]MCG9087510.1 hypothetical protein [Laribacter hongkongensis]MCG9109912.1 hypothetical protein [Laribacter hongkongensis]MCG9120453.1 hypothetical protein [Laribacter hongkongensis]
MITARKNDPESLGFLIEQRVNGVIANTDTEPMMNTTQQTNIAATQNEAWGFWGTMNDQAAAAWPIAMTAISDATFQPLESVRAFLDSRHGRHFADDVLNGLNAGSNLHDAIHAATQRWMGWTIGRLTGKQHDIPKGLPYLTGFVIHCEIVEEALAD